MNALGGQFAALEQRWRDRAVPPWRVLTVAPGPEAVAEAWRPFDVTVDPDIEAWFGWLGGSLREIVSDDDAEPPEWQIGADLMMMLSLPQAVAYTHMLRDSNRPGDPEHGIEPFEYWPRNMIAFAQDGGGNWLGFRSDPPGSIWLLEKGLEPKQTDASLGLMLERWVRQIDRGLVRWDPVRQCWYPEGDYERDPDFVGGRAGIMG